MIEVTTLLEDQKIFIDEEQITHVYPVEGGSRILCAGVGTVIKESAEDLLDMHKPSKKKA